MTTDKPSVKDILDRNIHDVAAELAGQLAALQQSNASLIEKWRADAVEYAQAILVNDEQVWFSEGKKEAAAELEARTKEATK